MDIAESLSIPSEPPDIRNWFSSYVYETPELNTDFQGYGFRGNDYVEEGFDGEKKKKAEEENLGECERIRSKDGVVLGEIADTIGFVKSSNTDEDHSQGNKLASQVLGSSDSISLSSEPPDITRWFSSYVCESPALETSDDFKYSVYPESKGERVACNAENCSKENGEPFKEFIRTTKRDASALAADKNTSSNELVKCDRSDRENKHYLQYNSEDIHAVDGNKMSSGQVLQGKPRRNYNFGSTQNQEKSSLDGQVFIEKKGVNRKSLENLAHQSDSVKIRKPTCASNDKENNGNILPEKGFVSTRNERNSRPNNGSCMKRSVDVQFDCLRNRVTDSSTVVRKPLSEATNIRHTNSSEITGKWQCPQKRKPNLGPPLKQLRLERWVRRV